MPTVKEIVEQYLKEHGFDGLAGDECGCGLDDLAPCDNGFPAECVPAYRVMCDGKFVGDEEEGWHDCPGVEHELFTPEKPDAQTPSKKE